MRALQAGLLDPDDPTLFEQSSACLGCRACELVCPAGVRYGDLLEEWRDHQWRGRHRPWLARVLMLLVRWRLPLRILGVVRGAASTRRPPRPPQCPPGRPPSLMLGCVERGLYPEVSLSATELCPELDVPTDQGCCGALHAHNGDKGAGERMAAELGERLPGTIVTTAGGCGAHLAGVIGKDRVKELSQYLVATGRAIPGQLLINGRRARVTLQDSCHLRNSLGVTAEPRQLLAAVADYVELPDAAPAAGLLARTRCCRSGAAGRSWRTRSRRSSGWAWTSWSR